jgi:hypothetical protein
MSGGGSDERSDDAYHLQAQAERLQLLAVRQQEIILKLRQLASDQREIVNIWESLADPDQAARNRHVERDIRELSSRLVRHEHEIIDRIAVTTADAIRSLRVT